MSASVRARPKVEVVAVRRSPQDVTKPIKTMTITVHNPSDRTVHVAVAVTGGGAVTIEAIESKLAKT